LIGNKAHIELIKKGGIPAVKRKIILDWYLPRLVRLFLKISGCLEGSRFL